jgi:hypothetical protein
MLLRVAVVLVVFLAVQGSTERVWAAGAGAGGRDVLHVPLSWCALQGSPAVAAPNILQVGAATPDTTTDAILWRRHERPTDNIYIPEADITFRSAINDVWGTLNFPLIADPDMTLGLQGDVRGEAAAVIGEGSEFATIIANCDTAWANLGRGGIGVTAVNIGLFHNANGDYLFDDGTGNLVGTPIGWGGCVRPVGSNTCSEPYDGRIMVADNFFLYPTVPDRTLPPSPNEPTGDFQYSSTDPFDQLVGHELGHALGLDHRTGADPLMRPAQNDTDGDGQTDNIDLNNTEITTVRQNAQSVPGLETDPPARVDPGRFVAMTVPDDVQDREKLPPHLDIASLNVALDKSAGTAYLRLNLRGITPERTERPGQFWLALDTERGPDLRPDDIKSIGAPFTDFVAADVIVMAEVRGREARGRLWRNRDGVPVVMDVKIELGRLIMYPHYTAIEGFRPPRVRERGFGIYDVVTVIAPAQQLGIQLGRPFPVRAASTPDGQRFDLLESNVVKGLVAVLENPSFPHCFVKDAGVRGGTAPVTVERLRPSRGFHALFGPTEVFRGTTDAAGNAAFNLPIPGDARGGLHLVTIGTDDTALTADCVVRVKGPEVTDDLLDRRKLWMLAILELMKGQEVVLDRLEALVQGAAGAARHELLAVYIAAVREYRRAVDNLRRRFDETDP